MAVIFMDCLKKAAFFSLGGAGYVGLEFLWRGYSHGSMFFAGGTCFLLLGALDRAQPRLPSIPRTAVGAGIITMVELATGLAVNRRYQVWDYRNLPGNYLGQICPQYSLLWLPVAAGAMALYRRVDACLTPSQVKNTLKKEGHCEEAGEQRGNLLQFRGK